MIDAAVIFDLKLSDFFYKSYNKQVPVLQDWFGSLEPGGILAQLTLTQVLRY